MTAPTQFIGKRVAVTIDRPLGTKHPRHDYIYPINYGYVENTVSGDGKELDVYVLDVDEPRKRFIGTCIAYVHREDDDDPKLIVVPKGTTMTDEEIMTAVHF